MQTCLLYIEIIQNFKNISVIYKDQFSWEKKTSLTKEVAFFWKLLFSVLIFSNENNIAKLVGDAWGNCFSRLCQLLCNWIRMNLIFKSSRSQMFYKISVLKKFANFAWKQLRPVTLLKRASNAGIFLTI